MTKVTKKLIEVALPLEAINVASAREKSIRHGHPSTLHLWWARRPLAAARAVIFSQMVDDPSAYVDVLRADPKLRRKAESALKVRKKLWSEARAIAEKAKGTGVSVPEPGPEPTLDEILADQERQRLFDIIEELVKWENTTNERVLQQARDEIWQSWRRTCAENAGHPRAKELFDRNRLPAFHDPFAGGGSLPLEAQRLGLESYASDLNPVAVLINKAMIEIPPRFAGKPPVNPKARAEIARSGAWHGKGAAGLAEDVRYYGQWMRDEAEKRIGHLYPKVEVTTVMAKERPDLKKYVGQQLTVIAWLWARTVKSPNPAFAQVDVPLASTFILSNRAGNEAYVEPVVEGGAYRFIVKVGKAKNVPAARNGTKLARANFACLMSGAPIAGDYLKTEGRAGRMGARLMAIVAEGERRRVFLPPTAGMEAIALQAKPEWKPDVEFFQQALGFRVGNYGMTRWSDIFSARQLVALTTFSDLVHEARERVKRDARAAGWPDDKSLAAGGIGASSYADAVGVYCALATSKAADLASTICHWQPNPEHLKIAPVFSRHALPMSWDYAEGNPFSSSSGHFFRQWELVCEGLDNLGFGTPGRASQMDATSPGGVGAAWVFSTDPPYFDNIGYGDLSDFFYVWLRQSLKVTFPELFATLVTPKAEELVATPDRHGGRGGAETFFMDGMTRAMHRLTKEAHPAFPVTIYYAFKQSESEGDEGVASTGWESFLDALISAGFSTSGTWPMRTERPGRMRDFGSNALASSIVLVCRKRAADAPTTTRREFVTALKSELPVALAHLQRGNIAPVDLAQAAIGPGMAVYTRFSKVLGAEGKALTVREALALINQTLDEALAEQEGDFDADSRWALTWFEQSGFDEGEYGVAEQLSKSKNTSVQGMKDAGILDKKSRGGKVRLLKPSELRADWDPATDSRLSAWEMVHHLIRSLEAGGESAAAELVAKLGVKAEIARELAYRLYTLCERKKRAAEALSYNGLVQSWPEIVRLAREGDKARTEQGGLFGETEE
jgi:putative DNA methylase